MLQRLMGVGALLLLVSCSKSALSERDAKLEQFRNSMETKREELQVVAGLYVGQLKNTEGSLQSVSLGLEVKDVPTQVEGQVDALLVPTLSGSLRFHLSAVNTPLKDSDSEEFVSFAIQKAEYDTRNKNLNIVALNSEFKDVVISLHLEGKGLIGSWTAPSISTSGKAEFIRTGQFPAQVPDSTLRGDYTGVLLDESRGTYQHSQLTIITSNQAPDGIKVSANLRVIYGSADSNEYLTYLFDKVQFNPINGQLILKNDQTEVGFTGQWSQGKITGTWFSSYTGKIGPMNFNKGSTPGASTGSGIGSLVSTLKGSYKGFIKNTHPDSNLPEKTMISFVTGPDDSAPNKIKVTGNMRLYVGGLDTTEYFELPFDSVQYNFFTRQLTARNTGDYRLTLKGVVTPEMIKGTVHSDALGEVATFEVKK